MSSVTEKTKTRKRYESLLVNSSQKEEKSVQHFYPHSNGNPQAREKCLITCAFQIKSSVVCLRVKGEIFLNLGLKY